MSGQPGLDNLTPEPQYGSRINAADVALQADIAALEAADVALDTRLDAVEARGAFRLLDYAAATDIHNGTAISANTWTDVGTNQSFTVVTANSVVEIAVAVSCTLVLGTGTAISSRVVVDSSGSPQAQQLRRIGGVAGGGNPFIGSSPVKLTNLVAGAHTIKTQIHVFGGTGTFYIRVSSFPDLESYAIQVTEHR